MYLRRVPRRKAPPDVLRSLAAFEEGGFEVGDHVFFAEEAGEHSGRPAYAHLRAGERDVLLRLEEDDESGEVCADLVDLGEEGLGRRPVHLVLREAIYGDQFDAA